jgi:hypothetical protein
MLTCSYEKSHIPYRFSLNLPFFLLFVEMNAKEMEGGPSRIQIHEAILRNENWIVLSRGMLSLCSTDKDLNNRANAAKHSLQVFGPTRPRVDKLRPNYCTDGNVFHCHVRNSTGKEFVMEWAVVSWQDRILALTCFDIHENFRYRQTALSQEEIDAIMADKRNVKTIEFARRKADEVRARY